MTDFIQKFIFTLQQAGIPPSSNSEIIANDTKNRYHISGDKPKSKNGVYQLKIDGDFAFGWGMSFKDGEVHKFTSKSTKKFTPDERAAHAKRVAEETAKRDAERKKEIDEAALKAVKIWKKAVNAGTTEYLDRKQCSLHSARISRGLVIVPAYNANGKITTLQFIATNSAKKFLKNGVLEGSYFPITTKEESKNVLLLCEGFSTGDAIRKATNLPVVVCFNAGNLLPVAEVMKVKYPESTIVFCGDNDEFTKINGEFVNVGLNKAKQAAMKIGGGYVVYPEFPDNNEDLKYSDFNDAFLALGLNYVKNRIQTVVNAIVQRSLLTDGQELALKVVEQHLESSFVSAVHQANMPVCATDDWKEHLVFEKDVFSKTNLRNLVLFLFNDPNLREAFVFDTFHGQVICQKDITGSNAKFQIHQIGDSDIVQCCMYFEGKGLLKDERQVAKAINYVAEKTPINPAVDYFETLKWDGVDRLDYWLVEAFDAPEPERYLADIGKKWVTAAVKRVFEPGCKFDHMLMLEGAQGAGKSSALELLAAFGEKITDPYKHQPEKSYYTDALTFDAIGDKDCMLLTAGAVIVVLEELVGKNKRSDDDIKRWITLRSDKGRLPYARFVTEMKRQFVLAGTTNNYDYLKDPTGNRRYWALTVRKVDKKYINDHREQMWAEAVHYYKKGMYLALEGEVLEMAEHEQKKRLEEDVWENAVGEALTELCIKPFATSDMLSKMNLALKDQDHRAMGRVKNILKKLGYENKPTRTENGVKRLWSREND